jgi:hypothetical protein
MLKFLIECSSQLTDFLHEHHTSGDLGLRCNVLQLRSTDPQHRRNGRQKIYGTQANIRLLTG